MKINTSEKVSHSLLKQVFGKETPRVLGPLTSASAFSGSVCSIFAIAGSLLIAYVILHSKLLRCHHRNCVFVAILASDFIMGIFALPLIVELFVQRGEWDHGCALVILVLEYANAVFPFITLWGMVILSVDRTIYEFAEKKPEWPTTVGVALAVLPWMLMLMVVLPTSLMINPLEDNQECVYSYDTGYEKVQTAVTCFLPCLVLAITTGLLLYKTRFGPDADLDPDMEQTTMLIEKDTPFICTSPTPILVTSIVSVVLLLPSHIVYSIPQDDIFSFDSRTLFCIVHLMAWAVAALFPFLLLTDEDIRMEVFILIPWKRFDYADDSSEYDSATGIYGTNELAAASDMAASSDVARESGDNSSGSSFTNTPSKTSRAE